MEQLIQDIVTALRPNTVADAFTYGIFFFALLTLVFLPDGNERPTYLLFITMALAAFDLLRTGIQMPFDQSLVSDQGFLTFFFHLLMFILPALGMGLIRTRKNKGGLARIMGIVTALLGLVYTVGFFALYPQFTQVIFTY